MTLTSISCAVRRLGILAGLLLAAMPAGCVTISTHEPKRPAPSYDLTEPPSRQAVGIEDGEKVVIYETDDAQPVTVMLPEHRTLQTEVTGVAFDSYGSGVHAATSDPTGMDLHTPFMDLDAAAAVFASSLGQLGAPTEEVQAWRTASATSTDNALVRSAYVRQRLGYLTVEVQGRYQPLDHSATVAYVLSWHGR